MAEILTLTGDRVAALRSWPAVTALAKCASSAHTLGARQRRQHLDLLVKIEDHRPGLADRFLDFCEQAEGLLGIEVDVLTDDGLDPVAHARIFREARALI